MQQLGSVTRKVLADVKRAMEAKKIKTLADGDLASVKIADPACPLLDKRAGGESDQGVSTLNRRPQLTVANAWEDGNGLDGGRATLGSEPIRFEANGRTRPTTPDEAIGGRSRHDRRSGGLG